MLIGNKTYASNKKQPFQENFSKKSVFFTPKIGNIAKKKSPIGQFFINFGLIGKFLDSV